NNILKLCRDHNIRHVLLIGRDICAANFRISTYSTRTGAVNHVSYFTQPKQFWDEMVIELMGNNSLMKMKTIHDDTGYPAGATAHFQFQSKFDDANTDSLRPVVRSKGFNIIHA
ncbi:hypothetical protein PRIPAC_85808, partial [Pristionchus pacificus]|uniref:Uncharacterized protein n=1 Tax=Pristionchus pacificus TaxID=54126 RepID=A0A2A6BTW9_PRIPA